MKPILGPIICTSLEKNALQFVEKKLSMGEPCSLVGPKEMAQEVLYRELCKKLPKEFPDYRVLSFFLTTPDDVNNAKEEMLHQTDIPTLVLIHLATSDDVSPFIDFLDAHRLKKSINFLFVIISDIQSIYQAIRQHKKSITRSLFVLSPLEENDAFLLMTSFEKRFPCKLSEQQKQIIIALGSGYFGLIKTLFLLQEEYGNKKLDPTELLQNDAVIQRLTSLANQLPLSLLKKMTFQPHQLSATDAKFLEQFGYMSTGAIRSMLLDSFLRKSLINPELSLQLILSESESAVFHKLKEHFQAVVRREQLAEALWGDRWEDKYSDWAIDQFIHKIREKLEKTDSQYEIITKKGAGFYLSSKEN